MEKPSRPGAPSSDGDVRALLRTWSAGDQDALQALTPIVYEDWRAAKAWLHRELSHWPTDGR